MPALDIADLKAHLNITVDTYDVELAAMIAAAEAAIGAKCGPLEATEVTERVSAGSKGFVLGSAPVVSLVTVTVVDGAALDIADLYLSPASGVVTGMTPGNYDVVYSAGRETCPADLLHAVKELVRHLWETKRGPTRRPGSTASEQTANTVPGAAYMPIFRVAELIAPHMIPGFA